MHSKVLNNQYFVYSINISIFFFLKPGNYSKATVVLQNNQITRFESSVFENLLQQMTQSTGSLYLSGSKLFLSLRSSSRKATKMNFLQTRLIALVTHAAFLGSWRTMELFSNQSILILNVPTALSLRISTHLNMKFAWQPQLQQHRQCSFYHLCVNNPVQKNYF